MEILTIDAGTTNTRSTLWRNGIPSCQAERPVGVRDTAVTGDKSALQNGVRESIAEVLQQGGAGGGAGGRWVGEGGGGCCRRSAPGGSGSSGECATRWRTSACTTAKPWT